MRTEDLLDKVNEIEINPKFHMASICKSGASLFEAKKTSRTLQKIKKILLNRAKEEL